MEVQCKPLPSPTLLLAASLILLNLEILRGNHNLQERRPKRMHPGGGKKWKGEKKEGIYSVSVGHNAPSDEGPLDCPHWLQRPRAPAWVRFHPAENLARSGCRAIRRQ